MPFTVTVPSASARAELVEWIDDEGRTIGVVTRARMRAERLRHRSVAIIVWASDGRLLIHRRADHKDVWPGMWDLCVGGVVSAGESFDEAAARELAEEVGIAGTRPKLIAVRSFDDDDVSELAQIYTVIHNGPYTFADGEVVEVRLVTPSELDDMVNSNTFVPDSLAIVRPQLGAEPSLDPIRWAPVYRVEFTIEPFVEGQPGIHVTAPIDALRDLGVEAEVGPFGSGCDVSSDEIPDVVAAIMRAAFTHGATHVNLDVSAVDTGAGRSSW
jgi:isopentenyldiphosphate isomerase/uncharacterized protein YqgV (UPF0045/DUF77 family)